MKYLILGGNAAGMSFTAKMRRNEPESTIIVIEKREYVSFGGCGLPYYVGGYVNSSSDLIARDVEEFKKQNIDLRILEEVTDIDFSNKKVNIKSSTKEYTQDYDILIITTGASPNTLFNLDVDYQKIFTLTSKKDGEALKEVVDSTPKEFTIIGSGFIGLEVLDTLIEKGHKINLVTQDKFIMDRVFGQEITNDIQQEILDHDNVSLYLEEGIENIEIESDIIVKTKTAKIKSDYLIFAIGFKPNSSFIKDIKKLPNGAIVVDQNFQTSQENVYALGDVASVNNYLTQKPMYVPLATTANKAGRALADVLSGKEVSFQGMLGSSIVKILDFELGRVGLTKGDLENEKINYKEKIVEDFNQTAHYKGQQKIKAKVYYEASSLQILGIEMVGKKGVHGRLEAMSVVISKRMTAKELAYIDFPYSPPFSRTWDFLNIIGSVCK